VALEELRPHSPFILGLKSKEFEEQQSSIRYLNRMIPSAILPEEIVNGKGDGLISKERLE